MLEARLRGGERYNLSVLPKTPIDIRAHVNEIVEDILHRGLRFVNDRVELRFHNTAVIPLSDGRFVASDFYPLDKDLTQAEIETINRWLLNFETFFDTPMANMAECIANHIMQRINYAFDKFNAGKLIVHFAPGDSITLANTTALPAYGWVVNTEAGNKAELETAFYIEILTYDDVQNEEAA